jgi:RNA polymerase subunit RPABC4/transcription elongation factor Spt4
MTASNRSLKPDDALACRHCGALVYRDTRACPQCARFPIPLHLCPRCGFISAPEAERCDRCGRVFEPGGDYL